MSPCRPDAYPAPAYETGAAIQDNEPWPFQELRVPLVTGEHLRQALFCISLMVAEMFSDYAALSLDDVCLCLDQLQEMLRRPELVTQLLAGADLAPLAGYTPAFIDPGQVWAVAPPPQAA